MNQGATRLIASKGATLCNWFAIGVSQSLVLAMSGRVGNLILYS